MHYVFADQTVCVIPQTSVGFADADSFEYTMELLGNTKQLLLCRQVCKVWLSLVENSVGNQALWRQLFDCYGVPMVHPGGRRRNFKADFMQICPLMGVTGGMIEATFGEIVGKMPCLSEEILEFMEQDDLMEPGKKNRETWAIYVLVSCIQRTDLEHFTPGLRSVLPGHIDVAGPVPAIKIPLSRSCIKTLYWNLPLRGDGKKLVGCTWVGIQDVPVHVTPSCVWIDLVRKAVAPETIGMCYERQEQYVAQHGCQVVFLRQRQFSNAVQFLYSGTCDDQGKWLRTGDTIYFSNTRKEEQVYFGYPNEKDRGLTTCSSITDPPGLQDGLGVIPWRSAEHPIPQEGPKNTST